MLNEIKRTEQWRCIQKGDTQAVRQEFDLLPKEEIRQSLLEEQHYLCAYCMKRIKNDGLHTTIEHWEPLSVNKDKALEYDNMLAVCDGGRKADLTGNVQRILCCDEMMKTSGRGLLFRLRWTVVRRRAPGRSGRAWSS